MKFYSTTFFLFFSFALSAQFNCDGLLTRTNIPFDIPIMDTLPPDPCGARPPYSNTGVLTVSPPQGQKVQHRSVVIYTQTTVDHKCNVEVVEVRRDTIVTKEFILYGSRTGFVGDSYVVQCEMLLEAPETRPNGFMATLLSQYDKYSGYWVVHYGEYNTVEEAQVALRKLKRDHPEFCSSFVRKLPAGCEFRYEY